MKLLIDMDNVVARLMEKWLRVYNATYNDTLTPAQITTWQIDPGIIKASVAQYNSVIDPPGFFADLDVFPDAIEVTQRLQAAGHDLYFVTATPYNSLTAGYDKCKWVDRHFPHIGSERVIQTHHKYMIEGDLLFDDGPKNLQQFQRLTVAMDFPYNTNIAVDYRVKSWIEFEQVIEKLTKP